MRPQMMTFQEARNRLRLARRLLDMPRWRHFLVSAGSIDIFKRHLSLPRSMQDTTTHPAKVSLQRDCMQEESMHSECCPPRRSQRDTRRLCLLWTVTQPQPFFHEPLHE